MSRKGVPNNTTVKKRELAKEILDSFSTESILKDIKLLKPERRLLILISLLEYVNPKLARKEVLDNSEPKQIIIRRV